MTPVHGHMCDRNCSHSVDRRNLYWALRTRVLTDEEMGRVASLGISLCIEPMTPYREIDKIRELNEALLQQFKLRAITSQLKGDPTTCAA